MHGNAGLARRSAVVVGHRLKVATRRRATIVVLLAYRYPYAGRGLCAVLILNRIGKHITAREVRFRLIAQNMSRLTDRAVAGLSEWGKGQLGTVRLAGRGQ